MLGDFSVSYQGSPLRLERTNSTKAMQVLQLLLFRFPAGIPRDKLLDLLYADDAASDPANNLKVTISNLRRLLTRAGLPEDVTIRHKTGSYFLCSDHPILLDVREFEGAMDAAEAAADPAARLSHLRRASALYTGDFLPHLTGSDWVVMAASKLRQRYYSCVRQLAELLIRQEDWEALLQLATQASSLHHLEDWQCLRIDALMKLERYAEAKQVYDRTVRELSEEYNVKPGAQLVERFRRLSLACQENTDTVAQITDQLQEPDRLSGAYYCCYPSFIDVYRLCCRVIERTGQSAFLLMCWLCDSKGRLLEDSARIESAADRLRTVIEGSLRRGDTFTQHGRDRFLVLLVGTDRENCSLISKRIEKNYKASGAWGVSVRSSLNVVGDVSFSLPDSGTWQLPPTQG